MGNVLVGVERLGDRANRQIIQKRLVLVGFADRRDTDVFDEILFLTFNLFVIDRQNRCEILDVYAGESGSFVCSSRSVRSLPSELRTSRPSVTIRLELPFLSTIPIMA